MGLYTLWTKDKNGVSECDFGVARRRYERKIVRPVYEHVYTGKNERR
jgi:hypothetical protein